MAQCNRFIIISIFALLSGCSQSPKAPETSVALWEHNRELKTFYGEWYGTPYQFGGNTKEGIDCSAFVQQAFLHAYQRALPRTTLAQFNASQPIRWEERQQGDLLFFKTTKSDYHVGIYLNHQQFMHASTSKGVIISRTDNPYWASKFWQIRRVTM
ncbi:C40 family peptidase [Vibrio vulnificus]